MIQYNILYKRIVALICQIWNNACCYTIMFLYFLFVTDTRIKWMHPATSKPNVANPLSAVTSNTFIRWIVLPFSKYLQWSRQGHVSAHRLLVCSPCVHINGTWKYKRRPSGNAGLPEQLLNFLQCGFSLTLPLWDVDQFPSRCNIYTYSDL